MNTRRFKFALLLLLPVALLLGLREQQSWKPKVIFTASQRDIGSISISPDGKVMMLNGSKSAPHEGAPDEYSTMIVDSNSGRLLHEILISTPYVVERNFFSPDSTQIAIGQGRAEGDNEMTFYDVQTGEVKRHIFYPTGTQDEYRRQFVWTATNEIFGLGQSCFVLNANSGKLLRKFRTVQGQLVDIAFSPDRTKVATLRYENFKDSTESRERSGWNLTKEGIQLRDVRTGKLLKTLGENSWPRASVEFSADGSLLASEVFTRNKNFGQNDALNAIQIWNPHTGRLLRTLQLPNSIGFGLTKFSPAENLLAFVTGQSLQSLYSIYLLDADTGKLSCALEDEFAPIEDICFSPDGKYLFVLQAGEVVTRHRIC